ncbi:MAG: stage II sporulation protein M [Thermoproteota archaeon]|nr:stage II sporulation protein M [Thermoproteota archaeon]
MVFIAILNGNTLLQHLKEQPIIVLGLGFEIKLRLLYLTVGMAIFLVAYLIGAGTNLGESETENLREQFNKQVEGIDQNGIFMNNLRISLGMFLPFLGVGLGIFSGFSTGLIFKVIAESSPLLNNISPLLILVTPFGVMEVFAYGLAISRSGMLSYQIIRKRRWRGYIIPTLIEVGIVVIVLLIGAVIEWQMIRQIDGRNIDIQI